MATSWQEIIEGPAVQKGGNDIEKLMKLNSKISKKSYGGFDPMHCQHINPQRILPPIKGGVTPKLLNTTTLGKSLISCLQQ